MDNTSSIQGHSDTVEISSKVDTVPGMELREILPTHIGSGWAEYRSSMREKTVLRATNVTHEIKM